MTTKSTWRDGAKRPRINRKDMDAILAAVAFTMAGEDPFDDDGATVRQLNEFQRKIVAWRNHRADSTVGAEL